MEEKNNRTVDITKYPEGPNEVIKHMDYLETDEERMATLMLFASFAMGC